MFNLKNTNSKAKSEYNINKLVVKARKLPENESILPRECKQKVQQIEPNKAEDSKILFEIF